MLWGREISIPRKNVVLYRINTIRNLHLTSPSMTVMPPRNLNFHTKILYYFKSLHCKFANANMAVALITHDILIYATFQRKNVLFYFKLRKRKFIKFVVENIFEMNIHV